MKEQNIKNDSLFQNISSTGEENFDNYRNIKSEADNKIIIIKSRYHDEITSSIVFDYINFLLTNYKGYVIDKFNISVIDVSGCFEIPLMIKMSIEKYHPIAVLATGCIIKGDTKHDEYLSSAVINAISKLSLDYQTIILNGILTTDNFQQAIDRAGTKMSLGSNLSLTTMESLVSLAPFKL